MRHGLAVLVVACTGCAAEAGPAADGADDSFLGTGKGDGHGLSDRSPRAIAALRVANGASLERLDHEVGLYSNAAENIVDFRLGPDGVSGTGDDRLFYSLAELDAIEYVGPVAMRTLIDHVETRQDAFGPTLHVDALPPELAEDAHAASLLRAIAEDPSLGVDGDPTTVTASEWERALLWAHNFAPEVPARIAALAPAFAFPDADPQTPFVHIATLPRAQYGPRLFSALEGILTEVVVDPHRTPGRIAAEDLAAADRELPALDRDFLDIWGADIAPSDPGDLPVERARTRDLLRHFGVEVFTGAYPPDRPTPGEVEALELRFPFAPDTEVLCAQGHNTMVASASHAPDQLRYALDLAAPFGTGLVAAGGGTAYVYDRGRPNKPDNWGFGNILLIDLGNGYALMYAHADRFTVETGDRVEAGERVAVIGNTGLVGPEPHLHLQVVPLFRRPDPASEIHQVDSTDDAVPEAPFGGPVPFSLPAMDLTAGERAAHRRPSSEFVCAEAGYLLGAGHIYRAP